MGGRRSGARKASPGNRVRDKTKQKILDAAMQAIKRSGLSGATVAEIRRRSGASTGSIYHHFGSKERIAATIYAEGMERYQAGMLAQIRSAKPARLVIAGVIAAHLDWVKANTDLARFLFTSPGGNVLTAARVRLCELNEVLFADTRALLAARQESGEIDEEIDFEAFIAIVVAPAQQLSRRWLVGDAKVSFADAKRVFARAAWRGVRANGSD